MVACSGKAAKRIRADAERGIYREGAMAKAARLRETETFWEHVQNNALPHFTADFKGGKTATAYAKWEMTRPATTASFAGGERACGAEL